MSLSKLDRLLEQSLDAPKLDKGLVKTLLEWGADIRRVPDGTIRFIGNPRAKNFDNDRAIFILECRKGVDYSEFPGRINQLLYSVFHQYGNSRYVDILLEAKADFNQVPGGIHKLLYDTFTSHGYDDRVKILLKAGANFHQVLVVFMSSYTIHSLDTGTVDTWTFLSKRVRTFTKPLVISMSSYTIQLPN